MMDIDPDEDVCRICAAPGDPSQPLFHPCKCSGTIRYIHQDCLATWLAHSKKTTCDVCKHKFAFTKVYDPKMPRRLPLILFLRRFSLQLSTVGLLALRGALVGIVWLAMLPYSTVWTWRFFFWSGDALSWFVAGRDPPHFNLTSAIIVNATTVVNGTSSALPKNRFHPVLRQLSSDIFTGQIITSVIVLLFLSLFLLREWIFQNAPAENLALAEGEQQAEDADHVHQHLPNDVGPALIAAPVDVVEAAVREVGGMPAIREEGPEEVEMPAGEHMETEDHVPLENPPEEQTADDLPADDLPADDLPPMDSLASETRQPEPADLGHYFSLGDDFPGQEPPHLEPYGLFADSESDGQPWEDMMPGLLPASTSQPTVSDNSFDFMDAGPSTSSAAEVISLASHSPETSDWQVAEDDVGTSSALKRRASMSSSSSMREASTSSVWSSVLIDGRPKVKRRKTITAADVGTSVSDTPNRGIKRTREDGDDSTEESVARERRDSLRIRQSNADFPVDRPRRPTGKRPPTPWRSPKQLFNSSDSDDERETDSADQSNIPAVVRTEPSPSPGQDKGKERAPPPPLIILNMPATGPDEHPSPSLHSPNRISPRRPALPPSLPTPIPRIGHRHGEDTTPAGSTSSAGKKRAGDSPGRAYYRAPEDMDYFGDVDETELSANDAPSRALSTVAQPELLNPPDRDLTANVANPVDEPPAPVVAIAPPALPRPQVIIDNEPQPLLLFNNDVDDLVAAADAGAREAVADDDMDGALEAVGMRGPIHQLFQNVALTMCILDLFIGAAVFLPFILGKSTALLSLDHRRALLIINLPIKLIRLITDPVVDLIAMILRAIFVSIARVLAPPPVRAVAMGVWKVCVRAARTVFPRRAPVTPASSLLKNVVWPRLNATIQSYSASAISYFDSAFDAHPSAEESFATIGAFVRHVKPHLGELRATYNQEFRRFIEKDSALSRTFAIAFGYSLIAVGLGIWMQSVKQDRIKGFAKTLRNTVHQQLLVAKVAFFIVIELLLFPLGCGIVLDLCAMPLFPEATIMNRVAFAVYAPITSTFIHWTLGTMFMFQFAMLLDGCRKIMRPGALWFLKDPQDPQYSPIQDILGRPAASQLRKLLTSALMYCFVVFVGIGSVIWFMRHFRPFQGFLPLRWNMHEPLSEVPIDLLFVHIVVPATVKQLRLRRYVKDLATRLWKNLSARLRLTSYMFGERHPEEEFARPFSFYLRRGDGEVMLEPDGGLFRVPANDQIMLVPRARVVVPLDAKGDPVDATARERMERQDEEAQRHGRSPEDDYTIVYLPPYFGRRVILFTFLIWMYGMAGVVAFISFPLLAGRALLDPLLGREVHDGYAFGVGFHLLAVGFYLGRTVYRVFARRPNMSALPILAHRALRGVVWLLKVTWVMFSFYVILPLLAGIALELHVILPVKFVVHPLRTPVFHLVENWASGVVLCQIAARLLRMRRAPMMETIDEARANGWANPQAWRLTKTVILPLVITGIGANVLPAYLARSLVRLGFFREHPIVLYRLIYPFWVMTLCQTLLLIRLFDLIGLWVQTVRDKEFLVELRLRNLEN
ncbi:hypothetical protein CALVIDRAFT_532640 [Calocera viscosa TUFC12733]|uniref:RING-type E3 ubiquitin transferase n=1 Tax=Calocera viscosa (strain TUFC12733) TaxID=1330018 RepID=A0A167SGD0_CALVF|nr:hypothetical protein CALVIDRAFT_532640 [Calocera viscosa TUFC12733]